MSVSLLSGGEPTSAKWHGTHLVHAWLSLPCHGLSFIPAWCCSFSVASELFGHRSRHHGVVQGLGAGLCSGS